MDGRFLWFSIGILVFLLMGGPLRLVAFLGKLGLAPSVTEEQVVSELKRLRTFDTVTCRPASEGAEWDFVCDYQTGQRRSREAIRTSKSWGPAIARTIVLPLERVVLTEAEAAKALQEEHKRMSEPVNVRTASIAELQRIPRVDQYRAQEIHAAVQFGLVRKFDDLLKIQGIDRPTLNAMRTRAYWK